MRISIVASSGRWTDDFRVRGFASVPQVRQFYLVARPGQPIATRLKTGARKVDLSGLRFGESLDEILLLAKAARRTA